MTSFKGPPERKNARRRAPWRILLAQFRDVLTLVLVGAAVLARAVGRPSWPEGAAVEHDGALVFDIRLQGPGETVFLELGDG
mgnify:CR=1 FL=1